MMNLQNEIHKAEKEEVSIILQTVLARYRELYPDWEISILSLEKAVDKNAQLDQVIAMLEKMKE